MPFHRISQCCCTFILDRIVVYKQSIQIKIVQKSNCCSVPFTFSPSAKPLAPRSVILFCDNDINYENTLDKSSTVIAVFFINTLPIAVAPESVSPQLTIQSLNQLFVQSINWATFVATRRCFSNAQMAWSVITSSTYEVITMMRMNEVQIQVRS